MNPRGFLSILAESTADPALVPSIPSAYSARNYFMISKHFFSLQSRFGYHFSGVEALVGDRAQENYISFQFKGGAAARELKIRRARMVAEILEAYGFRTDLHRDSVAARLENYEQPHMESRLAVIGYLVIHTRQLDMDLTSESAVKRHKTKILEDLKTVECDKPQDLKTVESDKPA